MRSYDEGRPAVLDRASVNAFTAGLLETGGEPATARVRQLASPAPRAVGWTAPGAARCHIPEPG